MGRKKSSSYISYSRDDPQDRDERLAFDSKAV